jgi:hypothetical protein
VRQSTKVFLQLLVFGFAIQGHATNTGQDNPQLRVFVMDNATTSQLLPDAERTASRVFRQAGVVVHWVNCSLAPDCPGDIQTGDLVIRMVPHARSLQSEVFGVSFLGSGGVGVYADVFLESIQQLRESANDVSASATLGAVIAHELGHLLLGTNAHSPQGIMQARWQAEQLRNVGQGRMLFTPEQAGRLRNKIVCSHTASEELAVVASLKH